MKEIKLGTILENAARLAGRQVTLMGVPDNWRALGSLAMNEGIRRIAAEKLPMMQRIEFRRYRPTWTSGMTFSVGQECWYGGCYWRTTVPSPTTAPGTDGSGWTKLEDEDVAAFIAFEQPWETTVIDRGSVDINRFAYEADPKYCPNATPLHVTGMTDLGVVLRAPAPAGVYVRFVPKYPNVSFVEWASTNAYEPGDVVYVTGDKECYQALATVATGGTTPSASPASWQKVRIAEEFEGFLTRFLAVDFLTEDQGKYQTKAAAEGEFERLCEMYHEGTGENRMRTGRFVR